MRSIIALPALLLAACTPARHEPAPLERQSFVSVYADLEATLWRAMRTTSDTLALGRVADSVLADHHVSRPQYLATVEWYNEDLNRWRGFYDEAGKILEERSRSELPTPNGSP